MHVVLIRVCVFVVCVPVLGSNSKVWHVCTCVYMCVCTYVFCMQMCLFACVCARVLCVHMCVHMSVLLFACVCVRCVE